MSGDISMLTWDDAQTASAEWYHVWIADVTGGGSSKARAWWFARATTTDSGDGNRSIEMTPELTTGSYEWFIRAWGGVDGMGPWSDVQGFVVQ